MSSPEPQIVDHTGDRTVDVTAIAEGKAVHIPAGEVWSVEDGDGVVTREFDTYENARAFWHDNGGALIKRVETSWVLARDWRERIDAETGAEA